MENRPPAESIVSGSTKSFDKYADEDRMNIYTSRE